MKIQIIAAAVSLGLASPLFAQTAPAFFAALLFSVLIVTVEAPNAAEILTNPYTWRRVWRNGILIWHEFGTLMPGAFERNPLPNGANGSLWTLTYELQIGRAHV